VNGDDSTSRFNTIYGARFGTDLGTERGKLRGRDADLGVGNRQLIVLPGIVVLNWRYNSDVIWRGEERVLLGVNARNIEQWSAYVGLASIANNDSEFGFSTDNARVELDSATGELILVVITALMGEWSALNRFSYQVVVTSRANRSRDHGTDNLAGGADADMDKSVWRSDHLDSCTAATRHSEGNEAFTAKVGAGVPASAWGHAASLGRA
jgi:hypothetical protein